MSGRKPVSSAAPKAFLHDSGLALIATVVLNGGNYFFQFVAARTLSLADFGAVLALLSAVNIFTIPAYIVLMIVARLSAELAAADRPGELRSLVVDYRNGSTFAGLASAALIATAYKPLAQFLNIGNATAIIATAAFVAASFVLPALRGALQGWGDFRSLLISNATDGLCRVLFGVGGIAFIRGAPGAIFGLAAATLVTIAVTMRLVAAKLHAVAKPVEHLSPRAREAVLGIAATTAALLVLSSIDIILVKHFFSQVDAGLYGALSLTGKTIFVGLSFASQVVLPSAAARSVQPKPPTDVLIRGILTVAGLGGIAIALAFVMPSHILGLVAGAHAVAASPYLGNYAGLMTILALVNIVATYDTAIHSFVFLRALVPLTIADVFALVLFHTNIAQVISIQLIVAVAALITLLLLTPYGTRTPDVVST